MKEDTKEATKQVKKKGIRVRRNVQSYEGKKRKERIGKNEEERKNRKERIGKKEQERKKEQETKNKKEKKRKERRGKKEEERKKRKERKGRKRNNRRGRKEAEEKRKEARNMAMTYSTNTSWWQRTDGLTRKMCAVQTDLDVRVIFELELSHVLSSVIKQRG